MTAFETYFAGLKNKKIAVLGLGVSNRPLVRLLLEHGCTVTGCTYKEDEALCAGGTATCSAKAVCDTCETAYGNTLPHTWEEKEELADRLVAAGYSRVDMVDSAGQFALRGGIVDVFPPYAVYETGDEAQHGSSPIRLEFFGDEIDRMGYFSPETQRFTADAPDELVFPPVREMVIPGVIRDEMAEVIRKHIRRLGRVEGADEKHTRAAAVMLGDPAGQKLPAADMEPMGKTVVQYGMHAGIQQKYFQLTAGRRVSALVSGEQVIQSSQIIFLISQK